MRPKEVKFQKARPTLWPVLEGSTGACFIVPRIVANIAKLPALLRKD
jgi:hypothetical protein